MPTNTTAYLYLVQAQCWRCAQPIKVAMIKGAAPHHFYGPEGFSPTITQLATQQGAVIRPQYSRALQTTYPANTCGGCQAFIGEHYLFTEYFMSAIDRGYGYEKLGLDDLSVCKNSFAT